MIRSSVVAWRGTASSIRKPGPSELVAQRAPDVRAPGVRPNEFGDREAWLELDHAAGHHRRLLEPLRSGQGRRLDDLGIAESWIRLRRAAAGRRRLVVVPGDIVSEREAG